MPLTVMLLCDTNIAQGYISLVSRPSPGPFDRMPCLSRRYENQKHCPCATISSRSASLPWSDLCLIASCGGVGHLSSSFRRVISPKGPSPQQAAIL